MAEMEGLRRRKCRRLRFPRHFLSFSWKTPFTSLHLLYPKSASTSGGPSLSRSRLQIIHRRICLTPRPSRVRIPVSFTQIKGHRKWCPFICGGDGGIRTLAPVARPTPLAGAPLRPAWVHLQCRPLNISKKAKCVKHYFGY